MAQGIRTSIRLTEDMHAWYKTEAERLGIPLNAMMIFALMQYQREQMVVPNIPAMIETMKGNLVEVERAVKLDEQSKR